MFVSSAHGLGGVAEGGGWRVEWRVEKSCSRGCVGRIGSGQQRSSYHYHTYKYSTSPHPRIHISAELATAT